MPWFWAIMAVKWVGSFSQPTCCFQQAQHADAFQLFEQSCAIGSGNIRPDKSVCIFGDDATTNIAVIGKVPRWHEGTDGARHTRPPVADGSGTARTLAPVAALTKCAPQLTVDTALNRRVPWHQAVPRGGSGAGRATVETLRVQRSAQELAGITFWHGFTGAVDSLALPVCLRERGLRSRRGRRIFAQDCPSNTRRGPQISEQVTGWCRKRFAQQHKDQLRPPYISAPAPEFPKPWCCDLLPLGDVSRGP
jgi:hypothetical protein